MPTYAYHCRDCDRPFERRMSISAYSSEATVECPECGSNRTDRSFQTVNVLTGSRSGGSSGACAPSGFG